MHSTAGWQVGFLLLAAAGSVVIGRTVTFALLAIARRAGRRWAAKEAAVATVGTTRRPLRILLAAITFRLVARPLQLSEQVAAALDHVTFALIVFTVAWFAARWLRSATEWASARLPEEPEHEIRHRVLRTQLTLMRQITTAMICALAMTAVLMQFAFVRAFGLSLLASAGLVGIVFGFAAQKPLASLMGGIQLSITQPIRIGDTVLIEKELGTIEKIHLTYVIVRLREQRMLVIPVSRFLETPFENWTFAAPSVIGSVLLSVDFATSVDALRVALASICAEHEAWDHGTCSLEVTDATERSMTLRALVSSADATKNWSLRCFVRERLIGHISGLSGGIYLPHERDSVLAPSDKIRTANPS